jgi:hypothetical protein
MVEKTPLRKEAERLTFCERYFEAVGAVSPMKSEMYREYRLPLDVDKELTDRPFFWLWAEKTNQDIEPTTLRLAFSDEAKAREDRRMAEEHRIMMERTQYANLYERMFSRAPQAELVDLGSFRLNKICDSAMERGKFACVKAARLSESKQMVPWLMLNGMIQYLSDSVQEETFSIAVCLHNRQTLLSFYQHIAHIPMVPCSKLELLRDGSIKPVEGLQTIKQALYQYISKKPLDWADEANERLDDDLSQLDAYYSSILPDYDENAQAGIRAEHRRKRNELIQKGSPRIQLLWTQLAFVGLALRP